MAKRKCAKCGKELGYFTFVLMMGPQGYRRYVVCSKCYPVINSCLPDPRPEPNTPAPGAIVDPRPTPAPGGHEWK